VKLLHFLLRGLLAVAVVAAVVVGVFLLTAVQTWLVQRALARHPEWPATVGGCSAFWGRVGVSDLTVQLDRAVFSAPSVELRVPLTAALRHRHADVQTLVAKGWMLDLTGSRGRGSTARAPAGAPATGPLTTALQATGRLVRTLLAEARVPPGVAIAAVDLEGDVYVPAGVDDAVPVHLKLSGGPLAAGRDAEFIVTAQAQPAVGALRRIATRGRVVVGLTAAGAVSAVRLHLDTTATPVAGPVDWKWANDLTVARGPEGDAYALTLERDGRAMVHLQAKRAAGTSRLAGDWTTELQAADLHQGFALAVPESLAVKGGGTIEADAALARAHVGGRLDVTGLPVGFLAPPLARAGLLHAALRFDLSDDGRSTRLDVCEGSAGIGRPVIAWRLLQPVDVGAGGTLVPLEAAADWLELGLDALPASWLPAPGERCEIQAGTVSGRLGVRRAGAAMNVRTLEPLQLADVTVASAGAPLLQRVDGTLAGAADRTGQQWEVRLEPLILKHAARQLASVTAKLVQPDGEAQPLAVNVSWSADLEAWAAQPVNRAGWMRGRSMTGEFAGTTHGWLDGEGSVSVLGHDPARTFSAKFSVQAEPDGSVTLTAPLTIAFGAEQSAFTAKVDWSAKDGRVQADLAGTKAVVAHLRALAAPALALGPHFAPAAAGSPRATAEKAAAPTVPFWGAWVGRLDTNFDQLDFDGREYVNVGGTWRFDHAALSLEGGRGKLPPPPPTKVRRRGDDEGDGGFGKREPMPTPVRFSGTIAFDPAAPQPYRLTGTMAREAVPATAVFPTPKEGTEAPFEGYFDLTSTYSSEGATLAELTAHLRQETKFRSATGIVRLLTANIAASLPRPKESAAGNALSGFGTAAGWLFGNSKAFAGSGEIRVSRKMEAVLDFRNSIREIGYDELTGTIVQEPDGGVRLLDFSLTAKDEHLTGSGAIAPDPALPLRERPLSFTLEFGARGRIAGLLSTAALLSERNDAAGYLLLQQPVRFGGTLAAIDDHEWRDLLVKAALQPDRPKR
jgi:hypothetical protein